MMDTNKSFILGVVLIGSGTLLLGLMHVAIAAYVPDLPGWSDPPGKFSTVMTDIMGWFPYVLSIIQIVTGSIFVLSSFSKNKATSD